MTAISVGKSGWKIERDAKRRRTVWIEHPDGYTQSAIRYDDGRIAYDFPERVPAYVQRAVRHLFRESSGFGGFDKNTLSQWRKKPFRKPDRFTGGAAIWYGPDGPKGENATVATFDGDDVVVEEYQYVVGLIDEPDADYTVQRTHLSHADILEAVEAVNGRHDYTNLELLRWAAGLGVAKIAYWGGEESWADELPR